MENVNEKGEWHTFDADGKPLGRLATEVASLLLGKHRVDSSKNLVAPVYVVITNTDKVGLTGNKENGKMYYKYSGHPGGLRERTAKQQRAIDSTFMVRQAVAGMLPKNNLRDRRLSHLKLYAGTEHPHQPQTSEPKKTNDEK